MRVRNNDNIFIFGVKILLPTLFFLTPSQPLKSSLCFLFTEIASVSFFSSLVETS